MQIRLFRTFSKLIPFSLGLLGLISHVHADFPYSVTTTKNLKSIAKEIQSAPDSGVYRVTFSSYRNVDQFKLDAPTAKIDSLVFERRADMESDSVIRVDSTLFDIKKTRGIVVLRGLAFQLTNPKAVLIAGAETGKENLHLILDECFIYADSLDNTFLSWATGAGGNIEIKRCYFVTRNSSRDVRINLIGGNILLANNVFNFPGAITTTAIKKIDFRSNTINRTQFDFTGKIAGGVQASYDITRNLVAYPGTVDAYGGSQFWVTYISGFDELESKLQNNEMGPGWQGFDFPNSIRFTTSTNFKKDSYPGKTVSELWDWYVAGDTLAGIVTGPNKRLDNFNVFPGTENFTWNLQSAAAKVFFRSTLFPRQIKPETDPTIPTPVATNADLRFLYPTLGPLHFGSFKVDSISLAVQAHDGNPVLMAKDSAGLFSPQPAINRQLNSQPSIFTNGLATTRYFFLAYQGNTSSGINITPKSEIGKNDSLRFLKVDSAGYTSFFQDVACAGCTKDLRFLEKSLHFQTTAVLKDSMIFGLKDSLLAYRTDSTYWMIVGTPNRLVRAIRAPGAGGKLYAKTLAGTPFNAYLVEKLSVPKGGVTLLVSDGSLRAEAKNGYQITFDSLPLRDPVHYGLSTKAYRYSSIGRLDGDSLTLHLKWNTDQEAFRDSLGIIVPLALKSDTAGLIHIPLTKTDADMVYFLAVKFNILADSIYKGPIEGLVDLSGFKSSTTGKLKFVDVAESIREYPWANKDSAFKSTLFLAGKELKKNGVTPVDVWDMTFSVPGSRDRAKIEAWWSDGKSWTRLTATPPAFIAISSNDLKISKISPDARYVVVVERLQPPENYVNAGTEIKNGTFSVTVTGKGDSLNRAITGYCVELKAVDQYGQSDPAVCVPQNVGTPFSIKLTSNLGYAYRVQYFAGTVRYGSPSFQGLEGASWDRSIVLPAALSLQPEKIWHLIGFPFQGDFAKSIVKHDSTKAAKDFLDTVVVMHVERNAGLSKIDTLEGWRGKGFQAGEAYLVGGTRSFNLKMDDLAKFLPLQPYRLPLDSGWYFIANPFPTTMLTAKIRSAKRANPKFWNLVIPKAEAPKDYKWDTTASLKAFSGYAYFARRNDTLTFDLLSDTASAPAAKNSSTPALVKISLQSNWASAQMFLTSDRTEGDIPNLSAPSAGLELRLGGGTGYMLKGVSEWQALDEPFEIRSLQDGPAAFSFGLSKESRSALGIQVRVIDLATGKIYDEAEAGELPLSKGNHEYRLLAGNAAFVAGRISSFLAGMPQAIGLSQNFPNPTRGVTHFTLDWPALQFGDRQAVFQVLDTRGREIQRIDLHHIQAGRQLLTLDLSTWSPGIYLYRLSIIAGGRVTRLQKRMLVSP